MKSLIKSFALIFGMAVIGALIALLGAKIAGSPPGRDGLDLLVYLVLGFLVGGSGFILLMCILTAFSRKPFSDRIFQAIMGSLLLAFLTGLLGVPLDKYSQKESQKRLEMNDLESARKYREFYSTLRSDPEIVVRDEWYHAADERKIACVNSLRNLDVNYTPATLSRLYDVSRPFFDDYQTQILMIHPSFDPVLLEHEFRQSMENARQGKACYRLLSILRSPNAKEDWFAEIVAAGMLEHDSFPCSAELARMFEKRDQDQSHPKQIK